MKTAPQIQAFFVQEIARMLKFSPDEIDARAPLLRYGLDSLQAVELTGTVEDWLGRHIDPETLWKHPTLEAVVAHIVSTLAQEP